jgi:hypothetical protein
MRSILIVASALALSMAASAQSPQDHAAHHPDAASVPQARAKVAPAGSAASSPGQIDAQMKSMREMHDKLMAAKTPAERQALMAEHMKVMQDGMAMMGRMKGGKPGHGMSMHHEMMDKRMDMMEMMMQMMMDREAVRPPAAK